MKRHRFEELYKGKVKTMTVAEFKAKLEEFPDDALVLFEWEDFLNPAINEGFQIDKFGQLIIWAETA